MRTTVLASVLLLSACDSPTESTLPAAGDYMLVAASHYAYPGWGDAQWGSLPFEYDVTGDASCIFRVTSGSLYITDHSYSVTLSQDVVSCSDVRQPLDHETGRVTRIRDTPFGYAKEFSFQPDSGATSWFGSSRVDGSALYVPVVPPNGGRVNYLRFERR
jgi:hypothetical protein